MYNVIDNILVIKNKDFTCFFDPESLIVFAQKEAGARDEEIIAEYNENKKSFPKIDPCTKHLTSQDFSNISLELHVTNDCNLRCKYCYLSEGCAPQKNDQEMSEETIEKAYRLILDTFPNAKNIHISLYGGEPLLFWKKFHFLVTKAREIFKDKKVAISFPTNGTIANEEILSFLKANNISFQLSWDGDENEQNFLRPMANGKGTAEMINKNLPRFREIRNSFGVRTTVTPYNMNLSKLFFFFKEKGFKKMAFATCSSCQSDLVIKEEDLPKLFQEWDLLADIYLDHLAKETSPIQIHPLFSLLISLHFGEKKSYFCGSGKNLFAISIEGGIYSCHRFIGDEKYKIGDLDRGFFDESSKSRTLFFKNVKEENECKNCFGKYLCAGGCFHERSQASFGTFCKIYTHLLAQAIRIYAELQIYHPVAFERIIKKLEEQKNLDPVGTYL